MYILETKMLDNFWANIGNYDHSAPTSQPSTAPQFKTTNHKAATLLYHHPASSSFPSPFILHGGR